MNEFLLGSAFTVGPPVLAALVMYLWGVVKAPWQLHCRFLATERQQSASVATLRNKTLRLAAEVTQFATMRRSKEPTVIRPFIFALDKYDESQREYAAYARETSLRYSERFVGAVIEIREEYSQLGIIDDELDNNYMDPLEGAIAIVGQRLRALADRLPLDTATLPSHELAFQQLRNDDVRLRKEVDSLRPRHLSQEHSSVITKAMGDVLAEQSKLWPTDAPTERLIVVVCTIGMDSDTVNYADALADALESAGYRASRQSFIANRPECADFKRGVTVIDDLRHPDNPYHKALASALREVGIAVKSAKYAPPPSAGLAVDTADLHYAAVTLTVGQRE